MDNRIIWNVLRLFTRSTLDEMDDLWPLKLSPAITVASPVILVSQLIDSDDGGAHIRRERWGTGDDGFGQAGLVISANGD